MKIDPGGWRQTGQGGGVASGNAMLPETVRRLACQRFERICGAVENRNGDCVKDGCPIPPAGELLEIIGPHDPNKVGAWKGCFEGAQAMDRIAGVELGFDVGDMNAWIAGHIARCGHAFGQTCHACLWFERVLR